MHISPGIQNSSTVDFKATVGHEIIHAVHYSTIRGYKKEYTEKVAYDYTAQVYLMRVVLRNHFYTSRKHIVIIMVLLLLHIP
jgi:hypothetical protein